MIKRLREIVRLFYFILFFEVEILIFRLFFHVILFFGWRCFIIFFTVFFFIGGQKKCEQYWSEEGAAKYGDISVEMLDTALFNDFTIRTFKIAAVS